MNNPQVDPKGLPIVDSKGLPMVDSKGLPMVDPSNKQGSNNLNRIEKNTTELSPLLNKATTPNSPLPLIPDNKSTDTTGDKNSITYGSTGSTTSTSIPSNGLIKH